MAKSLYGTSALCMDGGSFRSKVSEWSRNTALCALTEQVIFTDPYHTVEINHWTTPHLDSYVASLQADKDLKVAVADLKRKFVGSTEALLHGDLHTGSIMAKEGSTYVIDPEFAFYGPMGFDVGAVLANLFLAYYSQQGHTGGAVYADWLLAETVKIYQMFESKFLSLWSEGGEGEAFRRGPFPKDSAEVKSAQKDYMQRIFYDSMGFAGAKMIRRIVGIAHVADLDEIKDEGIRSECEKRSLTLARALILDHKSSFSTIQEVAGKAKQIFESPAPATFGGDV